VIASVSLLMDSYVCTACGGVVSEARRDAHEEMWCAGKAVDDVDVEEDVRPSSKAGLGGARGLLSSLCQAEVRASFGSLPDCTFTLAQRDMWGPADTGGALWYADRVMAEYLASGGLKSALHKDGVAIDNLEGSSPHGLVLTLGCGGVPLSGLIASALGWDVVFTDLGEVLEQTEENVCRNVDAIRSAREARGMAVGVGDAGTEKVSLGLRLQELPFGDHAALDAALVNADGEFAGSPERPLVIICSDCIWKPELHEPLVSTVAAALGKGQGRHAAAIFAWQRRNPRVEEQFMRCLRGAPGFAIHRVNLSDVLPLVQWPETLSAASREAVDLECEFLVHRFVSCAA